MAQGTSIPTVQVHEFTEIVKRQFKEKNYRPIFGLGKGGIGKSESMMNLAVNELRCGYIDIRLLLYNETDLKGIPAPNKERTKTIWLQNQILPTGRGKNGGIMVLDEITSCARSVRTAAYQLLNERKLGEYELPDGWLIVCLGNGVDDGGDFNGMEGNFVNRCSVFNVECEPDDWLKWARLNGVHPLVTSFIQQKPDSLHTFKAEEEDMMLFASPRSWKAVSDILNNLDIHGGEPGKIDSITSRRILGNIGEAVGYEFISHTEYAVAETTVSEIIKNGAKPKVDFERGLVLIDSVTYLLNKWVTRECSENNDQITNNACNWLANACNFIWTAEQSQHRIIGFSSLLVADKNGYILKALKDQRCYSQIDRQAWSFINGNVFNGEL